MSTEQILAVCVALLVGMGAFTLSRINKLIQKVEELPDPDRLEKHFTMNHQHAQFIHAYGIRIGKAERELEKQERFLADHENRLRNAERSK